MDFWGYFSKAELISPVTPELFPYSTVWVPLHCFAEGFAFKLDGGSQCCAQTNSSQAGSGEVPGKLSRCCGAGMEAEREPWWTKSDNMHCVSSFPQVPQYLHHQYLASELSKSQAILRDGELTVVVWLGHVEKESVILQQLSLEDLNF